MAPKDGDNPQNPSYIRQSIGQDSRVLTEETILLLEERLMVDVARRKIGEIVVRKEIESHTITIQVPVRRERLIVEQISPEYKILAEVNLGQNVSQEAIAEEARQNLAAVEPGAKVVLIQNDSQQDSAESLRVHREFLSLESAINALQEIYSIQDQGHKGIRIEITANDLNHKEALQNLFNSQDF